MGWLSKLVAPMVGETVKNIGEGVSILANGLRSAITGEISPESKAQIEKLIIQADSLDRQSQTEINKIEAAHKSIFIAGWRPFIGWICGVSLGMNFIIFPMAEWYMGYLEMLGFGVRIILPKLDMGQLIPLVFALLGIGGMRTYEKLKNVQGRHL